jgi:hypothetical protein
MLLQIAVTKPYDIFKQLEIIRVSKMDDNTHRKRMRALSQPEYEENPSHCLGCGTKISFDKRENRFCNRSCRATHHNKGVARHGRGTLYCQCGAVITKRNNKWCDSCIKRRVYNKTIATSALEELQSDKSRRLWLMQTRGHRCEMCGNSEWLEKPIALEIDHIDGNADHNDPENLRLLCPNCHATTPQWKGAVKGKEGSRYRARRKRYADGETW